MPFLITDIDILDRILTDLTPTAVLVVVVLYMVLKDRRSAKSNNNAGGGNPGSRPIVCPLDPTDIHQDLRDIVGKLEGVANLLNRIMGRLEDGGRRSGSG